MAWGLGFADDSFYFASALEVGVANWNSTTDDRVWV